MFTGIVQGKAILKFKQSNTASSSFQFVFPKDSLFNIQKGASIAINGICLTVTSFNAQENTANFDAIEETLRLTNLGQVDVGEPVNFERAAKFGDEIGGHLMSGHILTAVKVTKINQDEQNCRVYLELTDDIKPFILNKGYVGLNGCSLTIAERLDQYFSVHLIPETLKETTFGSISEGDMVNIEIDSQTQAIVNTVKQVLSEEKK